MIKSRIRKNLVVFFIIGLVYLFADNPETGFNIPDLKIRLLDGNVTSLHSLSNDGPLLIDFWATWCVPCKKLMKFLNKFHQKYSDSGFKVLMMNTDSPRSLGKVKSYVRSQDYKFLIGMDPNKVISKKLNGMVMPTIILVDKGGVIKWRHQGFLSGEEVDIENQIKTILGKGYEEKT